ncbi:DEAD/DEAH box helicase [Segnochrobactraceae bacterium EtOH-i3]
MTFQNAAPPLARALASRDYREATPVQAAVLEAEPGADLLVSAQTGSGKTVAYGLVIGSDLIEGETLPQPADKPLALVIAPTRELALQVQRELSWLFGEARARVVSCVGGMDPRREHRQLNDGAHIVVGTPGRLRDHLERGALDLTNLKAAVLDEADEMLDLGFREDLEYILDQTPDSRRTLLFSATLPPAIVTLAERYQHNAQRIAVAGSNRGHADIDYRAIRILPGQVEHAVVNVLRYFDAPSTIIFCATREAVRHLHAILQERGFSAVALSGELSQGDRNQALQALRDGRARVCVATDVAARGIDLPGLDLVIHAELPQNADVMKHRSGRTGRAGRKGVSVLLVPPGRRRKADYLFYNAELQPTWSGPPTADEIRKLDQTRLMADPMFSEEPAEEDLALAKDLVAEHSAEELAIALARLYRARLPAPEDVTDPGENRSPRSPRDRDSRDSRDTRKPGGPRGDSVWFRLNVGRQDDADPKWLLPMLCRRGGVARQDIGAIRIFADETRIEISETVSAKFAANVTPQNGSDIRIEPLPADARPAPRGDYRPGGRGPGGPKGGGRPAFGGAGRRRPRGE